MTWTLSRRDSAGDSIVEHPDECRILEGGIVEARWKAQPAKKVVVPTGLTRLDTVDLPPSPERTLLVGPSALVSLEKDPEDTL